jgi:predicted 3-demethylubiquinone-9 3-methyltransferase (glyoxalase superfamily)
VQTIIPHLWFDKEAAEAARWYVSLFEDSAITGTCIIPDTPSGDAELVEFKLANLQMAAISAGPYFALNPSVSLFVSCGTAEEVNRLCGSLCDEELMPLGEYPFSRRYAWVRDKYGLSWQFMLAENADARYKIRPCLLFSNDACGKAEEALDNYASVFKGSEKGFVNYYAPGEAQDPRAKVNYAELTLGGIQFVAMDNGFEADFNFNEAFSFMVLCASQTEMDGYWEKLTFVPEAEQCGWLKDRFGVSWQISSPFFSDVFFNGTRDEIGRVAKAFLKMKKFDLAALEKARRG